MTSPREPRIQLSAYEDIASIAERTEGYAGAQASGRAIDQIISGIELLGPTPYLGPLHHDAVLARLGYRKLVLGKYVAVYKVEDEQAVVLRVFHGSSNYVSKVDS